MHIAYTYRNMRTKTQTGFTIVELLIVIVVIGILAAITIVAYNGVQKRANTAVVTADLRDAVRSLEVVNIETMTYPSTLSGANIKASSGTTYQYSYDSANNSYCLTGTNAKISYFVSNVNQVPQSGGCAGDAQNGAEPASCLAILESGASTGSGLYKIKPAGASDFFQVYCDMNTSGGGWTLIVNNPGPYSSWNSTKVYSVNATAPSLSTQYSILNQADSIKTNIDGKLQYRLDAVGLGRWGGVWEAPYSNTFVGTTPVNNATNIEKYDVWNIDTTLEDTSALTNVMPYVSSSRLLTTWGGTGSWWGTIATASSGFTPAPYISSYQPNPGVIRYWVK